MAGGRPPKPTALKLLHGNPGKRPLPANEPQPPADGVKVPTWLKGRARRLWRQIEPILADMRVLTVADTQALALLCDALAEYVEAREVVRKTGMTYESVRVVGTTRDDDGNEVPITSTMVRQRPEVAIAADAWRRANQMLQQFGLTPSSRAKVPAQPKEEVDPFEELFGGNRGTG